MNPKEQYVERKKIKKDHVQYYVNDIIYTKTITLIVFKMQNYYNNTKLEFAAP